VDPDSLKSLREAFPGWKIEETDDSTPGSLALDWNPEAANLLIVGSHGAAATMGLCRGLRNQTGRALTPLLVLVPPAHEALVRAALDAGANSCLVLPVHTVDLVSMVVRAREGNHPGRHTLDLDRAQNEDQWRDEGGEA
jgi:2-keto-3-deoxy-L-rhamnonate aldolase RhmA